MDIPKNLTDPRVKIPYEYPESVSLRSYNPHVKGHRWQIKKAVDMLLAAKRPMIYSGGGIVQGEASAELTEFTQLLGYPITNTLMGLGAYPGTDKQFVGMLGMHGTYEANMAMHECDVLFAVGARFDDRITGIIAEFCPYAKVIHIDIDPSSISKNVRVDIPIVGEVKPVLADMIELVKASDKQPDSGALAQWWKQIDAWRGLDSLGFDRNADVIKPQYVVEQLWEMTQGDAYITSDVGQHQMWAAQFYKFDKPRRWINSGGLGTMGFGMPAAIGTKLAFPDADVFCITGEASIQMCIQELATARQYRTAIKIVNLNNGYMGMVRQWQEFSYGSRYSQTYLETLPDFVKLAESYGHVGIRIDKRDDVRSALEEAYRQKDRTVFLDFHTDPTENVYPMIEAGKAHHDMRLAPGVNTDTELA